jgi:hypothetical protein
MTWPIPEHMRPAFVGLARVTAKQAAERMAAGLKCRWCERADLRLAKPPGGLVGYACVRCSRKYKAEVAAKRKDGYQQRTYGITQAEKQQVIDEQDGGCICAPWTGYDGRSGRDLSTDHDHETGIVRGVLCKHCNDLLGRVRDDPTYFRLMIRYLESPPAVKVLGPRVVPT